MALEASWAWNQCLLSSFLSDSALIKKPASGVTSQSQRHRQRDTSHVTGRGVTRWIRKFCTICMWRAFRLLSWFRTLTAYRQNFLPLRLRLFLRSHLPFRRAAVADLRHRLRLAHHRHLRPRRQHLRLRLHHHLRRHQRGRSRVVSSRKPPWAPARSTSRRSRRRATMAG